MHTSSMHVQVLQTPVHLGMMVYHQVLMRCCPQLLLQVLALSSEKGKGGQEIPIPVVTEVASYSRDYLPTYRERPVYVRGRGEQRMA